MSSVMSLNLRSRAAFAVPEMCLCNKTTEDYCKELEEQRAATAEINQCTPRLFARALSYHGEKDKSL